MTAYLFDTSGLLLASLGDARFTAAHRAALAQGDRFVSQVCAIEIAIKHGIGRLALPPPFETDFQRAFEVMATRLSADFLAVEMADIDRLSRLPLFHRDPFDRLLIAQALGKNLTVVTSDRAFAAYPGLEILQI